MGRGGRSARALPSPTGIALSRFAPLAIQGFRCLGEVDIALGPLTMLLGVGGHGKASLLKALSLLSGAAAGRLHERLVWMGGLLSVLTIDRARALTLGTRMQVPDQPSLASLLTLGPQGTAESLNQ